MARKAKIEDDIAGEVKQPDFARAIKIIKSDVASATDDGATAAQAASTAWKTIEKQCNVNKRAAKEFARVEGMAQEKRDDYLRSFLGLLNTAKIGISEDLVTLMEAVGGVHVPVIKGGGEAPTLHAVN